jgi:hypothetical protein
MIRDAPFPKINHERVKSARKLSRTELISDRRGSADVVPFRSPLFRPPPSPRSWPDAAPPSRQLCGKGAAIDGDGYTIVHAGKQVRLGPVVFWIVVGTIVLLGMWSAATATYFAFRDDVLTRLIARQAEMQYAYEDRIAELRSKVDRTTSRQLLDQEQFDQKLDQIMRRQTALESRATALGTIPDTAATGSIRPRARGATVETPASGTLNPPRSATP